MDYIDQFDMIEEFSTLNWSTEFIIKLVFNYLGVYNYSRIEYSVYIHFNCKKYLSENVDYFLDFITDQNKISDINYTIYLERIGKVWSSCVRHNINIFSSTLYDTLVDRAYEFYAKSIFNSMELQEYIKQTKISTMKFYNILKIHAPCFYECYSYVTYDYDEPSKIEGKYVKSSRSFDDWCKKRMDNWRSKMMRCDSSKYKLMIN